MKQRKATNKRERRNVNFPMWRKKIDNSIFDDSNTPLPNWVLKQMNIEKYFPSETNLKKNARNQVCIYFEGNEYFGHVVSRKDKSRYKYRLLFPTDLIDIFKKVFLMSHMRSIETSLSSPNSKLEDEIPFWEFLDIEFDEENLRFYLTAHYTQKPTFPMLFKNLIDSPMLKSIEDTVVEKRGYRIHKQDWKRELN